MKTHSWFAVVPALVIAACTSKAQAKPDADPAWRPAIDLVLDGFEQHALVAVSDGAGHGQLETRDFFAALATAVLRQPSGIWLSNSATLDIKR
jgi:hypothetical protein